MTPQMASARNDSFYAKVQLMASAWLHVRVERNPMRAWRHCPWIRGSRRHLEPIEERRRAPAANRNGANEPNAARLAVSEDSNIERIERTKPTLPDWQQDVPGSQRRNSKRTQLFTHSSHWTASSHTDGGISPTSFAGSRSTHSSRWGRRQDTEAKGGDADEEEEWPMNKMA
jgi:hypothetical protein